MHERLHRDVINRSMHQPIMLHSSRLTRSETNEKVIHLLLQRSLMGRNLYFLRRASIASFLWWLCDVGFSDRCNAIGGGGGHDDPSQPQTIITNETYSMSSWNPLE
mmetsp:Transcript_27870/g.78118  ORF Transcript_27870/g.78118 Transcript_27870/m.78118 type:complete len:106 (-) Transcript_27870:1159-1476(-)